MSPTPKDLCGIPNDTGSATQSTEPGLFHKLVGDYVPIGVILLDPSGKAVYANRYAARITGYTAEELVAGVRVVHPDDPAAREYLLDAIARHIQVEDYDLHILRKSGESAWIKGSWRTITGEGGQVQWILVTFEDVTERKQMEESLEDARSRYQAIFEQSGVGIGTTDLKGVIVDVNPALEGMLGYSNEELKGRQISDITHPDDLRDEGRTMRSVVAGEHAPQTLEKRYIAKDGRTVHARLTTTAIPDASEVPVFMVGVVEDISQQKLAEQAARESEERYKVLAENASDLIWQMDTQGILLYVSSSVGRYGYEPQDWVGHHFSEFLPPDEIEKLVPVFAVNVTNPGARQYEVKLLHKDGRTVWIEVTVDYVLNGEQPVRLQGIARDITERKQAQEELQRAKLELQTILDLIPAMVFCKDTQNRFIWVNEYLAKMRGIDRDEAAGKTVEEVFTQTPADLVEKYLQDDLEVVRTGKPKQGIIEEFLAPDGTRWAQTDKVPYLDPEGNAMGVIGISFDITELKMMENALRESEERYRLLAENATDLIWLMDASGYLTYVSASARSLGYEPSECVGRHFTDFLPVEDRDEFLRISEENKYKPGSRKYEARLLRKDGSAVWVEVIVDSLFDSGEFVRLQGIARDITSRKLAQDELQRTKHEMQTILDSMPAMVFYKDRDLRCIWANSRLAQTLGVPREEVIGKTSRELHPDMDPTVLDGYEADDLEVALTGNPKRGIIEQVQTIDGLRWIQTDKVPFLDADGESIGVIGISLDITRLREMEQAIRESEEKYRLLFSMQPDAQLVFRLDTLQCLEASPSACELYGYTHEEFKTLQTVDVAGDREASLKDAAAIVASPYGFRVSRLRRHVKKDGTVFPVDLSVRAHVVDGVTVAHVSVRDMTERLRAQQAIEETSAFNRAIVTSVGEGIVVYDNDLRIQAWNPQMEEITGIPAGSVMGLRAADALPYVTEQSLEVLMRRAFSGERVQTVDISYSIPSTGKSGYLSSNYVPYRDAAGEVIGLVESVSETTSRRNTETALRAANAETESLYRSQRELLYNVAHEVRTPLTSVQGFTSVLLEGMVGPLSAEQTELLKKIRSNCNQLVEMVNEVLTVAKVRSGLNQIQPQACNPVAIVEHIIQNVAPQAAEKKIGLSFHHSQSTSSNLYDEPKLRTIAANLITNAVKFTSEGGVEVRVESEAGGVRIDVFDTGVGITADQLEWVFDEFRQAPTPGRHKSLGFGVGLSLVASIVFAMDGVLIVSSEPGVGSAFSVWIPAVQV